MSRRLNIAAATAADMVAGLAKVRTPPLPPLLTAQLSAWVEAQDWDALPRGAIAEQAEAGDHITLIKTRAAE